jgi:hypothetical protein
MEDHTMHGFYEFSDLKIGMRVNVEGEYDRFTETWRTRALSIRQDGDQDEMEGTIEEVRAAQRMLRLLGLSLEVPRSLVILDLDKRPMSLEALAAGMRLKVKGRVAGRRLEPAKIKLKEETPDACDEMEGAITAIDPRARTLTVLGYRIHCDADLEIEG